jgi:hypothetical protein
MATSEAMCRRLPAKPFEAWTVLHATASRYSHVRHARGIGPIDALVSTDTIVQWLRPGAFDVIPSRHSAWRIRCVRAMQGLPVFNQVTGTGFVAK